MLARMPSSRAAPVVEWYIDRMSMMGIPSSEGLGLSTRTDTGGTRLSMIMRDKLFDGVSCLETSGCFIGEDYVPQVYSHNGNALGPSVTHCVAPGLC